MSKKHKPNTITPIDPPAVLPGLYAATDFEQAYRHNGETLTVTCRADEAFTPPASWVRDGLTFITSDGKRILLPLVEK